MTAEKETWTVSRLESKSRDGPGLFELSAVSGCGWGPGGWGPDGWGPDGWGPGGWWLGPAWAARTRRGAQLESAPLHVSKSDTPPSTSTQLRPGFDPTRALSPVITHSPAPWSMVESTHANPPILLVANSGRDCATHLTLPSEIKALKYPRTLFSCRKSLLDVFTK